MIPPDTLFNDLSDLDHDPAIAAALGNMVVAWASADATLAHAYGFVLGIDANIATAGYYRIPTFESRIKVLKAYITASELPLDLKTDLTKAVDKLSSLAKSRNDWIHGLWGLSADKKMTVVFDYRLPGEQKCRPVKAADIKNHVEAVWFRSDHIAELTGIPPADDDEDT